MPNIGDIYLSKVSYTIHRIKLISEGEPGTYNIVWLSPQNRYQGDRVSEEMLGHFWKLEETSMDRLEQRWRELMQL